MTSEATLDAWLDATRAAAAEFAEMTLGQPVAALEEGDGLDADLTACFVALVWGEQSVQIGVSSNRDSCQALAQALFESDEPLAEEDVSDALGEIANIMAGSVKTTMVNSYKDLRLGLPIVLDGHLRLTDRQEMAYVDVKLGNVPARLVVIRSRDASATR